MPGVKWRCQSISRVFGQFPAAAGGGDGASGNGHLTDRSLPPSPAACPTIRQRDGQVTLGFHRHRTGDRAAGASAAAAALADACSWPDPGQTSQQLVVQADQLIVCSCRAAPARCMFCRGGGAADSGGLEHVSCCRIEQEQSGLGERGRARRQRWCNNSSVE